MQTPSPDSTPALAPIGILPILVLLVGILVISLIILMWYLSRTKAATTEARVGQYEIIVLPSGDRITGLTSLARSLVKQEYTQVLAQTGRVTEDQAISLNQVFDQLYYYGIRGKGRGKYLIVSDQNIEDPHYSIPLEQVFELPFGYITRRLVVADGVRTERAGWIVYSISPRNIESEIVGERYTAMANVGEAAACVKEAAIRLQKEMPWREVALARERQLNEAHAEIATISNKNSDLELALAKKPLLESEHPPEIKTGIKSIFTWDRILIPLSIAGVFHLWIFPQFRPDILDPLPYSIGIGVLMFFLWPWFRGHVLSRWF
jgi:hypothetical protein